MLSPGDRIELVYPTHTHVRLVDHCSRQIRPITIRSVRDLVADPLTPTEYMRRPYVARSRWLVSAFDESKRTFRQFYLGSSDQFRSPGVLRLAIYHPGATRPHRIITDGFEPTVRDRRLLVRCLLDVLANPVAGRGEGEEQIRIIADDLRRIG